MWNHSSRLYWRDEDVRAFHSAPQSSDLRAQSTLTKLKTGRK